jgi:hypothetical protein
MNTSFEFAGGGGGGKPVPAGNGVWRGGGGINVADFLNDR